jgi:hypothetical protein
VPGLATSGHLTVRTVNGQAVSSGDFFVPPPGSAVIDVETTGRVTIGTPTGLTITNSGAIQLRVFDGIIGHRMFVTVNRTVASCYRIKFIQPNDDVTVDGTTDDCGTYDDVGPIFLPFTATYTVATSGPPSSATLGVYDVVDQVGTITAGGSPVVAHLTTPGQRALLSFSATSGQRVSLFGSGVTIPSIPGQKLSILDPFGLTLVSSQSNPNWIDATQIATTGTHTVVVDPLTDTTGDLTVNLYSVPNDVSQGATVNGPAVSLPITTPGQNAFVQFDGNSGDAVTVHFTSNTLGPNASAMATITDIYQFVKGMKVLDEPTDQISFTISFTGTHLIAVNPLAQDTGSMSVQVTRP